ncbi:AbrB/MazE/SpoVT family DNA-binding domain-containing protein [Limimaricola litoreus]|uniref:AbrB/MazE/SpoVT family DNA-binding domain-containing protein n=1 Tax=Limimaricola litoreus TaxID=2955316 RepID=A0A9X2FPS3_9RHOB|nr:AbrB/MazE/SpoVT family DNA-binding domain-containing protein [Limimaricola litoreus]MCP1168902.1 AbrB/MazE/SpoVT family DNA-binding domain-containing protein [Limimaricola litoreus]
MPIIDKWGTTLAVRIPEALVRNLGLGEGDQIALRAEGDGIAVSRNELPMGDSFPAAFRNARGTVDPDIDLES